MKSILALLFTITTCITSSAQMSYTEHTLAAGNNQTSCLCNLDQLSWLVGNWKGVEGATISEEQWTKPIMGNMLGMYRMFNEGKPVFYEIMLLIQDSTGVKMQLKHFWHPLKGWEEKNATGVIFNLLKIEGTSAYFDGITYELRGENDLVVYLAQTEAHGKVHEEIFRMRRSGGQ